MADCNTIFALATPAASFALATFVTSWAKLCCRRRSARRGVSEASTAGALGSGWAKLE